MKDDVISRQEAIDALSHMMDTDGFRNGWAVSRANVDCMLRSLPSAQPEIIRCKECKHLQKWRSEESVKKFGQIYECARNVLDCPKPEDFCSHAERRADG